MSGTKKVSRIAGESGRAAHSRSAGAGNSLKAKFFPVAAGFCKSGTRLWPSSAMGAGRPARALSVG